MEKAVHKSPDRGKPDAATDNKNILAYEFRKWISLTQRSPQANGITGFQFVNGIGNFADFHNSYLHRVFYL